MFDNNIFLLSIIFDQLCFVASRVVEYNNYFSQSSYLETRTLSINSDLLFPRYTKNMPSSEQIKESKFPKRDIVEPEDNEFDVENVEEILCRKYYQVSDIAQKTPLC